MHVMNLPPIPPSDSLYKFTAIGGLILAVLSLYVPEYMRTQHSLEWFAVKAQFEKLQSEVASVEQEAKVLQAESETWRAFPDAFFMNQKDEVKEEKWIRFFFDQQGLFDRKRSEFLAKRQELQRLSQQTKSEIEKLKYLKPQLSTLFWISMATLPLGVILMSYGFWNWYFRFQIYQDQIIKAQAAQWTKARTTEHEKEETPG